MEYNDIVELYKQSYDVYGFAEDFFTTMRNQKNPKAIIESFIAQDTKRFQGLTIVFHLFYHYMDEVQKGATYTKIIQRLEKLDPYFFMECYFHQDTNSKK